MSITVVPPSGTGLVDSVNTKVGVVVLDPDDLVDTTTTNKFVTTTEKNTWNSKQNAMGADDNYVTDAEKTVIGNTSGTNTGDNATNSQYSGLAASKENVLTGAANKATIVDGDKIIGLNSESADVTSYWLWSAIKSFLKTYNDSLYFLKTVFTAADEIQVGTGAGTTNQITLAASQFLGKKATGAVTNLTATEARTILNVADGANNYSHPTGDGNLHVTANSTTNNGKVLTASGTAGVYTWETPSSEGTAILSTGEAGGTKYLREDGDGTCSWQSVASGAMTISPWLDVTGTYASTNTFTCALTTAQALAIQNCLFTCLNTGGGTRRIGYVKSATETGGTGTVTVVTDTDLASGDNTFKVTPSIKIQVYERNITIPEELVVDATNPQGIWYDNIKVDSYLLPVDSSVRTAAAGAGAAAAFNVYKDTTNLFSSAQDLTTNNILVELRPTTNTISATDTISVRVTSSAGATNKAKDLQVRLYIVPQSLFTGAA